MLNSNQSSRHTRSFYIHIDTFCIRRTYCCLVENGSIYLKRKIDHMARILIGITYGFQTIYAAHHCRINCTHKTTDIIHNYNNNNSKTKNKTMHNQLAAWVLFSIFIFHFYRFSPAIGVMVRFILQLDMFGPILCLDKIQQHLWHRYTVQIVRFS